MFEQGLVALKLAVNWKMSKLIYVLEDDHEIARIMRRALSESGYDIAMYHAVAAFNSALRDRAPDLALIDLGLPDGDGMSVVSEVLRGEGIPSIIVTARGDLTDRIVGLEVGADDYIVKPFEARELLARVRAVLRRTNATPLETAPHTTQKVARFDGWTANFSGCTLTDPEGKTQELSAAETVLLQAFVRSAGRVLSRSQLLDTDDDNLEPFDRSIDARISRLRRKLRDNVQSPRIIRTVYGAGYVFAAKVRWENP